MLEGRFRSAAVTNTFGAEVAKSVEMVARSIFFSGTMMPVAPRRLVYAELTADVIQSAGVGNEIKF